MITLLLVLALMCVLFGIGFKITGFALKALLWMFVLLPVGLTLCGTGVVLCCTLILIPIGLLLIKAGVHVMVLA